MGSSHSFDSITSSLFDAILQKYPQTVKDKLHEPDKRRYERLPQEISHRRQSTDGAYLAKSEVVDLVDWKLHHGTYRPKLKQLVESNDADAIRSTSKSAFASFDGSSEKAKSCLAQLSAFKGIGPATASLLLSVAFPNEAPFFSDELFRWCFWAEGKGKGWDRPINYTPKEYMELFAKVSELRARIGVRAVDAEKVAYVLGNSDPKTLLTLGATKDGPKEDMKRKADDGSDADTAGADGGPVPKKVKPPLPEGSEPAKASASKKTAKGTSSIKKLSTSGTRSSARIRSSKT